MVWNEGVGAPKSYCAEYVTSPNLSTFVSCREGFEPPTWWYTQVDVIGKLTEAVAHVDGLELYADAL